MLEVKLFEVRDRGTFIPCIGINMRKGYTPSLDEEYKEQFDKTIEENYLLGRCGYSTHDCILFGPANDGNFRSDPYLQSGRTMPRAHTYILENWSKLTSGDVIDVEFILGETQEPKKSERLA